MIYVEAGTRSLRSFDAQLIFAEQLSARGFNVCIDAEYLPEDAGRGRIYEAAKFLVDPDEYKAQTVFRFGAQRKSTIFCWPRCAVNNWIPVFL